MINCVTECTFNCKVTKACQSSIENNKLVHSFETGKLLGSPEQSVFAHNMTLGTLFINTFFHL